MHHTFLALPEFFRCDLTLVGEHYLDRAFGCAGSFTEVELFWNFVILGIYFYGPSIGQVKTEMKCNVTSLRSWK